jgi:hypothetical protein
MIKEVLIMSIQDLIKKHLEEKCEKCTVKDKCTGITVSNFKEETKCIAYEK